MKWRGIVQPAAWVLWALLLCSMIAWIAVIVRYPFRASSFSLEPTLVSYPVIFSVAVANIFLFTAYFRCTRANIVRCVAFITLTVIMCVTASDREFELEQVRWEFDGTVARKYRSDNHGHKSVEIKGLHGGQYELVDDSFWTTVQPGDRVIKKAYSVHALVNGEKTIVVLAGLPVTPRGRELIE